MSFESISKAEFNQLLPQHLFLEQFMGQQIEWFANKEHNLIGTIAMGKVGRSWNYAILRRNKLGNLEACDLGENFYDLQQTTVQFAYAMAAAETDRQEIRPSAD